MIILRLYSVTHSSARTYLFLACSQWTAAYGIYHIVGLPFYHAYRVAVFGSFIVVRKHHRNLAWTLSLNQFNSSFHTTLSQSST